MRIALLLLAVLILVTGCPPKAFKGKDYEMMAAAKQISRLVNDYHSDTAEWPESFDEVRWYLPAKVKWPVNPYNGETIADTGSRDFDPETSVGMLYYEKIYRGETLVNIQIHVFGEKGKLYIIGNTALGLK